MVQVFTILFFVGLGFVLLNFLYQLFMQKMVMRSWSVVRIIGYVLAVVSSVFLAFMNPDWFHSFEGYACAVAVSWTIPFIEEWLLLWGCSRFKRPRISI